MCISVCVCQCVYTLLSLDAGFFSFSGLTCVCAHTTIHCLMHLVHTSALHGSSRGWLRTSKHREHFRSCRTNKLSSATKQLFGLPIAFSGSGEMVSMYFNSLLARPSLAG